MAGDISEPYQMPSVGNPVKFEDVPGYLEVRLIEKGTDQLVVDLAPVRQHQPLHFARQRQVGFDFLQKAVGGGAFAVGLNRLLDLFDQGLFIEGANFKSIGSLVLITCFFVRQNRFGALIQTFSQKTAKNQISGRFPPLPSTRYVLDILLFTSA